jgi:hypothetical protein
MISDTASFGRGCAINLVLMVRIAHTFSRLYWSVICVEVASSFYRQHWLVCVFGALF